MFQRDSLAQWSLAPRRGPRTSRQTSLAVTATRAGALASFGLVAAACGTASASEGAGSLASSEEVATLEDTIVASVVEDEEVSPEDAALAFSQCMRDEGLDFPDLVIDAEGNLGIRQAAESLDVDNQLFRDAREVCESELAAGGFGGGRQAAFESPEVQDGLLAFSDCVRDAGFEVGDLTLGAGPGNQGAGAGNQSAGAGNQSDGTQNGGVAQGDATETDGEADGGPPEGRREGGFGNRTARLAQQLDLDPEDPEVIEVIDTCSPILEEAFTAAGAGQGRNN